MVSSRSIETILAEIRRDTPQQDGEGVDAFMKRTWHLALLRHENESPAPTLPKVVERQARSRQAVKRAGKIIPEREED